MTRDLETWIYLGRSPVDLALYFDGDEIAARVWKRWEKRHPDPSLDQAIDVGALEEDESDSDQDVGTGWMDWLEARSRVYERAVNRALAKGVPRTTWVVDDKGIPRTGGPGGISADVIRLAIDWTNVAEQIGAWIVLGTALRAGSKVLRRIGGRKIPRLSAGAAAAYAADAIRAAGGNGLTFAFASPVRACVRKPAAADPAPVR